MTTCAILLPSGFGPGTLAFGALKSGSALDFCFRWPVTFLNLNVLHRLWLKDPRGNVQQFHPKYLKFEAALKSNRAKHTNVIESTATIPLPITEQSYIYAKENMKWAYNLALVLLYRPESL